MSRQTGLRHRLYRRLRILRALELLNVLWIPLVLIYMWTGDGAAAEGWLLRGYALALVCYLLLQGSLYWHLKLHVLTRRWQDFPDWFVPLFRNLRRSNWFLLLAFPLLFIVGMGLGKSHVADAAWSIPLFIFALLEQINYYYYQLAHDSVNDLRYLAKHRRLRRSALSKDLEKAPRRGGGQPGVS